MIHTVLYLALSVAFAWLLWIDRPARTEGSGYRLLRTVLLILLPVLAFGGVAAGENGTRLMLHIHELRVPLSTVLESPSPERSAPYLVVGDRPEMSDLVVPPYADR